LQRFSLGVFPDRASRCAGFLNRADLSQSNICGFTLWLCFFTAKRPMDLFFQPRSSAQGGFEA
jgi:hypothetical protein